MFEEVSQQIALEVVPEFALVHPEVATQLPTRSDPAASAYDFYAKESFVLKPGERRLTMTDVCAKMPAYVTLLMNMRSGMGNKHLIRLANPQGIIDASYYHSPQNQGNIGIWLYNEGDEDYAINIGDRIAQGLFTFVLTASNDNVTGTSRKGGFGSSGK